MDQNENLTLKKLNTTLNEKTLQEDLRKEYSFVFETDNTVYLWGIGQLGMFAYRQFTKAGWKVIAFIDNNKDAMGGMIDGIKIISADMVETNHLIVICTKYFPEIEDQIMRELSNPCLYYGIMPVLDNVWKEWDTTLSMLLKKLCSYRKNYSLLFEKCSDQISRDVLEYILNYRFTLKKKWLEKAYNRTRVRGGGRNTLTLVF